MLLYRTSSPKRRNSLSFLSTGGQQSALLAQLERQSWINEIFDRPLPIPLQYPTRFGPPGFSRNVLYASELRATTFFEYGYALLKSKSILGRGIAAVCFEVDFQSEEKPKDVRRTKNRDEILDPKSYAAAHAWLTALSTIPESIRYASVREPGSAGTNFAIYARHAVFATRAETEELILTPQPNGEVEVESLMGGRIPAIRPLR